MTNLFVERIQHIISLEHVSPSVLRASCLQYLQVISAKTFKMIGARKISTFLIGDIHLLSCFSVGFSLSFMVVFLFFYQHSWLFFSMVMLVFGGVPSTFSLCPGSVNVRNLLGSLLAEKGEECFSSSPEKVTHTRWAPDPEECVLGHNPELPWNGCNMFV